MSDIFKKRTNIKPYEYPDLLKFKDAIRHSYWIHTEFNTTSDIQDFKTKISDSDREVLKRTMLAISQIEVNVKRFWSNLYNYFPKPEIDDVGVTFGESESRHKDAYAFLLEKLGLDEEFEKIYEIPAIIDRVEYLEEFLEGKDKGDKQIVLALILFSLFIEHVSLFGQFYIIMAFNKEKNLFKGMSNIVEATSKEEEIHGRFGIELFNIIKREKPEIFNDGFEDQVLELCAKAIKAEDKILDWIFEEGDLDFASKDLVKNYIHDRFNKSIKTLGYKPMLKVDKELLKKTEWFDIEVLSTKDNDFFNKRSIDYSKKSKTITEDELF